MARQGLNEMEWTSGEIHMKGRDVTRKSKKNELKRGWTKWIIVISEPVAPLIAAIGRGLEAMATKRQQSLSFDHGKSQAGFLLSRVVEKDFVGFFQCQYSRLGGAIGEFWRPENMRYGRYADADCHIACNIVVKLSGFCNPGTQISILSLSFSSLCCCCSLFCCCCSLFCCCATLIKSEYNICVIIT